MPGFTLADYNSGSRVAVEALEPRAELRLRIMLSAFEGEHEGRHWFYPHPFCPECRGGTVDLLGRTTDEGEKRAAASLAQWLILNPNSRMPRDTWDGTVPDLEASSSAYLTLDELRALPPAEMLVDELVPQGSVGYITGRDGTGKTFLALDLAMHLVAGKAAWNGREVKPAGLGRVLFVAGEGARSFPKRIDAWLEHHGVELSPVDAEALVVRSGAVDLYAGAEPYRGLLAAVREHEPDLVVIDTLNRAAGAAEQNSASDMSVITARIAEVRAAGGDGCTVIVVAHTDKGDRDARGSSAIEDDADFVLHCKKSDDRVTVTVAKMKDGESGQALELRAQRVLDSLVLAPLGPDQRSPEPTNDQLVIDYLRGLVDPVGTQADIARGTKLHRESVKRAILRLLETGYLVQRGEGRGARFVVNMAGQGIPLGVSLSRSHVTSP